MKTIEGECCQECLVLARCRNKNELELVDSCQLLRLELYKFGCNWVEKYGATIVSCIPLNAKFHIQKSSEKRKYLISGNVLL